MRILGIDYGDARIGLAVCDPMGILASPLKTYRSQTMRKDIDHIALLAQGVGAELIVLGLPLNMDGTEGERASKTRALGRNLEKVSGIKVEYQDERLSTVTAEEQLKECHMRREKRKENVDAAAAVVILQAYLDKAALR